MKYSVFIRSYKGDIDWLIYCLKSIHKHLKGFTEIVIVVPESQKKHFEALNFTFEKLKTCPDYENDYLGQQITKHFAFQYCENDWIMFMDSDCVFFKESDINDYVFEGKPRILKTPFITIPEVAFWQEITSRAIGFVPEFETMRRHGLIYHKDTLNAVVNFMQELHGKPLQSYIKSIQDRSYSEFNVIGSYADKFEGYRYNFIDTTKEPLPELKFKQYHSWSGISQEVKAELEEFTR